MSSIANQISPKGLGTLITSGTFQLQATGTGKVYTAAEKCRIYLSLATGQTGNGYWVNKSASTTMSNADIYGDSNSSVGFVKINSDNLIYNNNIQSWNKSLSTFVVSLDLNKGDYISTYMLVNAPYFQTTISTVAINYKVYSLE